jgi:hypothetical protein
MQLICCQTDKIIPRFYVTTRLLIGLSFMEEYSLLGYDAIQIVRSPCVSEKRATSIFRVEEQEKVEHANKQGAISS